MNKTVSVIVTTKNEDEVLNRLLQSIKAQTYPKLELIVVDNKSTDNTKMVAKKYTKLVFDIGPERSAQRNFGAKKAKGQYLLFVDADMELTKEVVASCVKSIEKKPRRGMIIIPEISIAKKFWEKIKAYERSFYNHKGDETIEAARFFKRKIFFDVGGYDESITGPEDWDLPEQIKQHGYIASRIKSPIYHHERIKSVWDLGRKKYYYGLKAHTYMKKNKISMMGAKTIYILRPVFYKQWKKLLKYPIKSLAMFFMLSVEQIWGGFGYISGRIRK